jgi:hypothetical protein
MRTLRSLLPRSRRLCATLALPPLALFGCLAALGSTTASAAGARAAATPACQTSGLVVWMNTTSNGAAGSFYYTLYFTNLSGRTCTLRGYPGVSGVSLSGAQLGAAASRDTGTAVKTATLANGRTASAVLRIVDTGALPTSSCKATNVAGLRVFPPGQTTSKVVPFPFTGCSARGAGYISVQAVKS